MSLLFYSFNIAIQFVAP